MTQREGRWQRRAESIAASWQTLRSWPWIDTARRLRQRLREDRLAVTAGSLTFTTLIAMVPLLTVMLALFSAFPVFARFQAALQQYFLQNLIPDAIARPVLAALTQFAAKANRLGSVGLVFLLCSALALMLTIDRTLNAIWRVRNPRPIAQRVLVYWAAATLGPLVLGVSLSLTSYVLSASKGIVSELPGGLSLLLNTIEFALLAAGMHDEGRQHLERAAVLFGRKRWIRAQAEAELVLARTWVVDDPTLAIRWARRAARRLLVSIEAEDDTAF